MTGDVTSALALDRPDEPGIPPLPDVPPVEALVDEQVILDALTAPSTGFAYPPPTQNLMPAQDATPARPAPP